MQRSPLQQWYMQRRQCQRLQSWDPHQDPQCPRPQGLFTPQHRRPQDLDTPQHRRPQTLDTPQYRRPQGLDTTQHRRPQGLDTPQHTPQCRRPHRLDTLQRRTWMHMQFCHQAQVLAQCHQPSPRANEAEALRTGGPFPADLP